MKKFTRFSFVFIFIFVSIASRAQIGKGSVLLGGSIGVYHFSSDDAGSNAKNKSVSLSPMVGVAIKQNTVVGIFVNYTKRKDNLSNPGAVTNNKVSGGGLFLRKYLPLGKSFYLFAQSDLYYNATDYDYTAIGYYTRQKGWATGIDLSPGLSYALTRRFQLETSLGQLFQLEYAQTQSTTNANTNKSSGVNFNISASPLSSINLGFRIFLSRS